MFGNSHSAERVSFVQWTLDVLEYHGERPIRLIFGATDLIN